MTTRQLAVLNALVTYAAENIPGGLSAEEQEVAEITGRWVLGEAQRTHNYKVVNTSFYADVEEAANTLAEHGWRAIAVIPSKGPGYAHQLVVERPIGLSHPDD